MPLRQLNGQNGALESISTVTVSLHALFVVQSKQMGTVLDKEYQADDFCIEAVLGDAASILASFSCGNDAIDNYFRNQIKDDANVCYIYRDKRSQAVVGAAAVCCSGIILENHHAIQLAPAIKIEDFAVSSAYQDTYFPGSDPGEMFYLSDAFLCELIVNLRSAAEETVGARYIILYSVPDAEHFYERNFFEKFSDVMSPERTWYIEGCIPMLLEI